MSGNSDMQKVLRCVVRDHRVPRDYHLGLYQPMTSSSFISSQMRIFKHRIITKSNYYVPAFGLFVICPLIFLHHMRTNWKRSGDYPFAF